MALLLLLLIIVASYVLGNGVLKVLYGSKIKEKQEVADCVIVGGIVLVGLAEGAHMAACFGGCSFGTATLLFAVAVVVCTAVCGVLMLVGRKGAVRTVGAGKVNTLFLVFAVLVLLQMVLAAGVKNVYWGGDMTLETVNSFLAEDGVYQVNPMTGKPYTLGIPLRLKILCLPTLYAMLCNIFGLEGTTVVLEIVPLAVIMGSCLAYTLLAKRLFAGDEAKRGCFLILVAVLFLCGGYMYGMDGFGILHGAYRGVTIRAAVLLPYTFGVMLRKRYRLAVLCVLAEACMVWTFYGLGACALVIAGMLCLELLWKRFGGRLSVKLSELNSGKEDAQ